MNATLRLELGGRVFILSGNDLTIIGDGQKLTINATSVDWSDLHMFAVGYNTAMIQKEWNTV